MINVFVGEASTLKGTQACNFQIKYVFMTSVRVFFEQTSYLQDKRIEQWKFRYFTKVDNITKSPTMLFYIFSLNHLISVLLVHVCITIIRCNTDQYRSYLQNVLSKFPEHDDEFARHLKIERRYLTLQSYMDIPISYTYNLGNSAN